MPRPIDQWFPAILEHHGLEEIPVNGAIAARSTPQPNIHHDPFERINIATAIELGLTMLTPDPII